MSNHPTDNERSIQRAWAASSAVMVVAVCVLLCVAVSRGCQYKQAVDIKALEEGYTEIGNTWVKIAPPEGCAK